MKKNKKIALLLVIIILVNLIIPLNCNFADVDGELDNIDNGLSGFLGGVVDGIVGIITWIPRAITGVSMMIADKVLEMIFPITEPSDIVFNKSNSIVNIDFFDFENGNEATILLRKNVAKWYFALRNLAIIFSLIVLIYVGIRMAISTIAEEKAKYKQMITNWLVGFILIFFIHYIIIIVIQFNNAIVDLLQPNTSEFFSLKTQLLVGMFSVSFIKGMTSLLCFIACVGVTIALFFAYMKRMLTVGFLILISPLITLTYSIDKMGDGKSQALNTWLTEFVFNVLIQPFQCVIYLVFVTTTLNLLSPGSTSTFTGGSIGASILAIMCMTFIFKAEDIVKKIFGFEKAGSLASAAAAGAIVGSAVSKLSSSKGKSTSNAGKSGSDGDSSKLNLADKNKGSSVSQKGGFKAKAARVVDAVKNPKRTLKSGANNVGSALKNAASKAKGSLKKIKDNPKTSLKNGAKQVFKAQGKVCSMLAKGALKYGIPLAAGALVAGATGDFSAATAAGYGMKDKGKEFGEKFDKMELKGKQNEVKKAFEEYQKGTPLSDDDVEEKAQQLMYRDISTITDPKDKKFAKKLQELKKGYKSLGVEKPGKEVMKDIKIIKNIRKRDTLIADVEEAKNEYKLANPSFDDKDIKKIELEMTDKLLGSNPTGYINSLNSDITKKDYAEKLNELLKHVNAEVEE